MSAADSPDTPPPPMLPVRPAPLPGTPAPHAAEEPTVQVTFALEPRDLEAFQNYALKRQGRKLWWALPIVVVLAVAVNAVSQFNRHPVVRPAPRFDITGAVLAYGLPVVLIVLFYFFFLKQQNSRRKSDQTGTYDPRTVGLSQTYLHSIDKQGEGRMRWNAVNTVDRGKQHLFVLLTNNTGYVIPDRAFADDAAALAFYEQAVAYWRSAATNAT